MNRRDVLKTTAAMAALPILGSAQSKGKLQTFTPEQNETVIALTEAIIPATDTPGAKAAKVNQYMDLLLHDGPEAERTRFLEGLKWFEEYAVKKGGAPFAKLAGDQQSAVLESLQTETDENRTGYRFFRMAKNLTSRIYYQTQIGFQELNKGGRVPSGFGCKHPEHRGA